MVPVLRWSPNDWRKAEAIRDDVMRGSGTGEPWFMEEYTKEWGESASAVHWRKPLRVDEVPKLALTTEVKLRPGRA